MKKINADEILQRGIELMKRKRFKEAENEFKRIDQGDNAQYLRAQCYLIDIYFINKRWIEVIKALEWILDNRCSHISKEELGEIQFKLGCSYFSIERWKDAVDIFRSIKEHDCKFYDAVRIEWAGAHIKLDQPQKAVELFLQVSADNQKCFDRARFRLGILCLRKGLGAQAVKAFESISSENRILYSNSRMQLGILYLWINEYNMAMKCFENILNTSKDRPDICAAIQCLLVDILAKRDVWEDKSLRQRANSLIKNIINLIPQFNNDEAFLRHENQLAIGKMHLMENKFTEAKSLFKEQLHTSYHDSKCFWELVLLLEEVGPEEVENIKRNSLEFLEIIDEIAGKLLCAQNIVNYDALDASLESLKKTGRMDAKLEIDDFKSAEYHSYEYKFAHYSRCETAFKLIGNSQTGSPSAFRLGSIGNVNDPKEGVVLGQYLGKCCKLASDIFVDNEPYATFVGCFTFNHDSLNQFRLYGKENNQEASGVSLVFSSDFFAQDDRAMHINNPMRVDDQDRKLKNEDDATNETLKVLKSAMNERGDKANTDKPIKYNLYRCIYIDPETGYLSLARRDKATFYQECVNSMNSKNLDSIRKMAEARWENYSKIIERKENGIRDLMEKLVRLIDEIYEDGANAKEFVDRFMRIGLLKLQYLVKHAAYQEEQECRIIYITGWEDKKIRSDLRTIYVECDGSVVEHLDGIYLSPGAKDAKDHFRVLLRDMKIKREIKIRESRNPFRHR